MASISEMIPEGAMSNAGVSPVYPGGEYLEGRKSDKSAKRLFFIVLSKDLFDLSGGEY